MNSVSRRSFMKAGAAVGLIGAPVAASAAASAAAIEGAAGTLATAAAHPFRWWVSISGGEVFGDECETREEAIRIAQEYGGGVIAECQQQDFDLRIYGDMLLEMLADSNEEKIGDGDFISATRAQIQELEDNVNAVIQAWADRHGFDKTAWVFGDVRNQEKIAPPAAPDEARGKSVEQDARR